uniref:Uncharacterized protein n=1 Tax=Picea sitchensis TaxID=3332 RepID=A0A6B9XW06_PICSI|nr:hypothetical protein Q903MT_gene5516 [Picea sitchensis]
MVALAFASALLAIEPYFPSMPQLLYRAHINRANLWYKLKPFTKMQL